MPKLTDTQAILLSTAAQRPDGSLLPPPETLGATSDRIRKAVATLIKRALAEEVAVLAGPAAWRSEDDRHWGAAITDAGRMAIGVEPVHAPSEERVPSWMVEPIIEADEESAREPASPLAAARQTKSALVLDLLRREQGATLAELVEATGWLPHTTRAALTGLRKKGHGIAKGKRDEATCYTVAGGA